MPTTDPQPPADPITTDRLVAAVRKGMATQPLLAKHARPVADRLTAVIRKRLPDITAADTGALMIHLSAYLSVEIAALSNAGETPQSAILVATSGAAVAGVELYGDGEQPPATPSSDAPDEAPYAAARLRAWFQDTEGPMVMDEADFDDVLTVLTAYERTVATPPAAADLLTLDDAQIIAWLDRQRTEARRLCNVKGLCETCRRSVQVIARLRALLVENAQSKADLTQLQTERDRYRTAWRLARQRARAAVQAAADFRLGHGGAWCATCRLPMREGTKAAKVPAVVCKTCAADLAETGGRLDPSRLAARREQEPR